MSVVNIRPDEKSITGKIEKYRSYTTSYIVLTDDEATSPLEIFVALASGLFPVGSIRKGSYAAWDADCICKDVSINQDEQLKWIATAQWSNEPGEAGKDEDGKPVDNPLDAYPVVRITFKEIEIQLKKDFDNKEYNNAAGEPLLRDSNTAVVVMREIITVDTNEEDFDRSENEEYSASCNSNVYFDYAAKRVMFKGATGESATWTDEDNITQLYWKVSRSFECLNALEPDLIPLELANMGMRVNDGTKLVNIIVAEGTEDAAQVTEPVALDESGAGISTMGVNYIPFRNFRLENYDFFDDWGIG